MYIYSCSRGLVSMFGAFGNICFGDTVAKSLASWRVNDKNNTEDVQGW